MNRQLRILKGLHHGAAMELAVREQHLIGSDAQCAVVMCDSGIAPRHCVIGADDYGMTCRALGGPVTIDGRQIKPGETRSLEDFAILQCGAATMSVGPAEGDWSIATRAMHAQANGPRSAMRSLQRLNPYALFAVMMLGIAAVIGVAYATLSSGEAELVTSRVDAARRWLRDVAPPGSELTVGVDSAGRGLLLAGYVLSSRQVQALYKASKSLRGGMRLDVHAVEDMLAGASRTAQLAGVECDPTYKGAGRIACRKRVANDTVAVRLRGLARDVPGLRLLDVDVEAPPPPAVVVASAPVEPPPPTAGPPRLTQKFAVLMFRKERLLIGPYGERYREGDEFDGFTIERIEFDKVIFARDGRRFSFYLATLQTAAR